MAEDEPMAEDEAVAEDEPMAEDEPFRFLDLPIAVRKLIYSLCVLSPTPIHPNFLYQFPERKHHINSALLAASRQINQEATAVFRKNVGVICDHSHWYHVRHNAVQSPFSRMPKPWNLNDRDWHLEKALERVATHYEPAYVSNNFWQWQRLLNIRERNHEISWGMLSRLDHHLINVNWIDATFFGIYPRHWHDWSCCELLVIYMLRPFYDLVMWGEASMSKTVVLSLR